VFFHRGVKLRDKARLKSTTLGYRSGIICVRKMKIDRKNFVIVSEKDWVREVKVYENEV